MTEDELLQSVLDLCTLYHLRTAHFRPARTLSGWRTAVAGDGKGFPDLVIAGPYGLIMRELKTDRAVLDTDQTLWLKTLVAAGVDHEVWRPAQWRDGTIRGQLEALRHRRDGGG